MRAHPAKFFLGILALFVFSMTAAANAPQFSEGASPGELRWKKVSIPIAFSNSLLRANPALRPDSDVLGAVKRSLETWETVADIEFQVTWTDKLSVSPVGNSGDGTNLVTIAQTPENLTIFSGEAGEISARTRVFFNRKGTISEADIVLNSYQQFSTDGALGTFDLESTLTHEIGHLLGLEHSPVIGATMNEFQGKNGVYNLSSFSPRTLGDDDIAAVRAIYGAKNTDENCCGAVSGKITLAGGKGAKNFQIWLEDSETGRVASSTLAGGDGSFDFEGLPAAKYQVYAQEIINNLAAEKLGEIEVVKGRAANFNRKITAASRNFSAQFIGFNGQLSKLSVPVNSGKSYLIYVGGINLNPDEIKVAANSPFISVTGINLTKYDYGKDLSVMSFEIKIEASAPGGEYSLYLKNKDGETDVLIGALTVEKYANPWSIYNFIETAN